MCSYEAVKCFVLSVLENGRYFCFSVDCSEIFLEHLILHSISLSSKFFENFFDFKSNVNQSIFKKNGLWHWGEHNLQHKILAWTKRRSFTARFTYSLFWVCIEMLGLKFISLFLLSVDNDNNNNNNERISRAPFHVKHAEFHWTGASTKIQNTCI